jgi:hypothetical protein
MKSRNHGTSHTASISHPAAIIPHGTTQLVVFLRTIGRE